MTGFASDEVHTRTAAGLIDAYGSGATTPTEVVSVLSERARGVNELVNAVITDCTASALESAAESELRYERGTQRPLEGVPIGLKDTIATAGIRTTGADAIYGDWIPDEDATLVQRLKDAGAVIVAKNSAFSFALGHEVNTHHGATRNPWDTDRTTGGSSSGSGAAVATRQVPVSIGSDTGGSIRLPATWCGVSGLKPTFGRVPTRGAMPLAWSMDTTGPLARTAEDIALVMDVIAGWDPLDSTSSRSTTGSYLSEIGKLPSGIRLGVSVDWYNEICHPEVQAAFDDAIQFMENNGIEIVPVSLPHAPMSQTVGWVTLLAELGSLHEITIDRLADYDVGFAEYLINSQFIGSGDYLRAQRLRTLLQDDYTKAFDRVDAILVPGNASFAPRFDGMMCDIGEREVFWLEIAARTTYSANITGIPGLAIPAGLGSNGLPLGIQILGRPFGEQLLLQLGHLFQTGTNHHELQPPITCSKAP